MILSTTKQQQQRLTQPISISTSQANTSGSSSSSSSSSGSSRSSSSSCNAASFNSTEAKTTSASPSLAYSKTSKPVDEMGDEDMKKSDESSTAAIKEEVVDECDEKEDDELNELVIRNEDDEEEQTEATASSVSAVEVKEEENIVDKIKTNEEEEEEEEEEKEKEMETDTQKSSNSNETKPQTDERFEFKSREQLELLDQVYNSWRNFDFKKAKSEINNYLVEFKMRQQNYEDLNQKYKDASSEMKSKLDVEVLKTVSPNLQTLQSEIENLSKRCKSSECSYVDLFELIVTIPDPFPIIDLVKSLIKTSKSNNKACILNLSDNDDDSDLENKNNNTSHSSLTVQLKRLQTENKQLKDENVHQIKEQEQIVKNLYDQISETTQANMDLATKLKISEGEIESYKKILIDYQNKLTEIKVKTLNENKTTSSSSSSPNSNSQVKENDSTKLLLVKKSDANATKSSAENRLHSLISPSSSSSLSSSSSSSSSSLLSSPPSSLLSNKISPINSASNNKATNGDETVRLTRTRVKREEEEENDENEQQHDEQEDGAEEENEHENNHNILFRLINNTNGNAGSITTSSSSNTNNTHEDGNELDTNEIAQKIRDLLNIHNIGQRVFAKYVLGLSQGTVSELLSKPKSWDKLTEKGRESYRKMNQWSCSKQAINSLKTMSSRKNTTNNNTTSSSSGFGEENECEADYRSNKKSKEAELFQDYRRQTPRHNHHSSEEDDEEEMDDMETSENENELKMIKKEPVSVVKNAGGNNKRVAIADPTPLEHFPLDLTVKTQNNNNLLGAIAAAAASPSSMYFPSKKIKTEHNNTNAANNNMRQNLANNLPFKNLLAESYMNQLKEHFVAAAAAAAAAANAATNSSISSSTTSSIPSPSSSSSTSSHSKSSSTKNNNNLANNSTASYTPFPTSNRPPSTPSPALSSASANVSAGSTSTKLIKCSLPPVSQEQFDKYSFINTDDLVRKVKDLLSKFSISQRLFGECILGLSQGSVSDLLARPKPWIMLTQKGREPFIRMQMFIDDQDAIKRLMANQYKPDSTKNTSLSGSSDQQQPSSPLVLPIKSNYKSSIMHMQQQNMNMSDFHNNSNSLYSNNGSNHNDNSNDSEATATTHSNHHHLKINTSHSNTTGSNPATAATQVNIIPYDISTISSSLGELNTDEITNRVKETLLNNNIGQKLFGEAVLNLSQGTVSELLSKPKPWNTLSIKGREPYLRMYMWLNDSTRLDKLSEWKEERSQLKRNNNLAEIEAAAAASSHSSASHASGQNGNGSEVAAKPKRRFIFTEEQKDQLLRAFKYDPYPAVNQMELLATKLNLATRTVINWFHNHRMRIRYKTTNTSGDKSPHHANGGVNPYEMSPPRGGATQSASSQPVKFGRNHQRNSTAASTLYSNTATPSSSSNSNVMQQAMADNSNLVFGLKRLAAATAAAAAYNSNAAANQFYNSTNGLTSLLGNAAVVAAAGGAGTGNNSGNNEENEEENQDDEYNNNHNYNCDENDDDEDTNNNNDNEDYYEMNNNEDTNDLVVAGHANFDENDEENENGGGEWTSEDAENGDFNNNHSDYANNNNLDDDEMTQSTTTNRAHNKLSASRGFTGNVSSHNNSTNKRRKPHNPKKKF